MLSSLDYVASSSLTSHPSLLPDQCPTANTMAAHGRRFLSTRPSLSTLFNTESSLSAAKIQVHENANNFSFPKLPSSGSNGDNMNVSGKQTRQSNDGACYYNNILFSCTHVVPGAGPPVIHVNCPGVPLGKIHCGNMSLNPDYLTVNLKCRRCFRHNARTAEAAELKTAEQFLEAFISDMQNPEAMNIKLDLGIESQTRGHSVEKAQEFMPKKSIFGGSPNNLRLTETRQLWELKLKLYTCIDNLNKTLVRQQNRDGISETEAAEDVKTSEAAARLLLEAQSKFYNATTTENTVPIHRNASIINNSVDSGVDGMTAAEVNQLLSNAPARLSDVLDLSIRPQTMPLPTSRIITKTLTKSTVKEPRTADQMAKQFNRIFAKNDATALTLRPKLPAMPMAVFSSKTKKMPRLNLQRKSMAEPWHNVDNKPSKTSTKAGTVLKEATEDGWDMLDELDEHDWVDLDGPSSEGQK